MKPSTTTLAALCLGLVALGAPASAGPEHASHASEAKKDGADKATLEELVGPVKLPELFIGSKAPELQIAKFVKGDSVEQFEPGQVYVVEFWATWCGPCIDAFPHLSQLQSEYKDKVQFIGVNVWERFPDQATRIAEIEKFVNAQGDRMSYTVAVEDGTAMVDSWMLPADQRAIPAAFIVDGEGTIAWIGHPMNIDASLKSVLAGEFDPEQAIELYKEQNLMMTGYRTFIQSMQTGENVELGIKIARALIDDHFQEEPRALNAVAWVLLSTESDKITKKELNMAYEAAKRACDLMNWEDWMSLDTFALACHKTGRNEEAIKWQTKAIELLPEEAAQNKPEMEAALKRYKEAD